MNKLILASSSATRKSLLSRLGIPFEIISPNIDESPLPHEKPYDLALRLAIEKARAVKSEGLIIGSDQVILCGETRLDKPETVENAVKQLTLCSGKYIDSYTGLALFNTQTNKIQSCVEYYRVYFRELSEETIRDYIKRDNPLQCAGSIKAEGLGMTLIAKMEGDDYTALLGLPLIQLTGMLIRLSTVTAHYRCL